jgi:polysaccharide export outer membrane protein
MINLHSYYQFYYVKSKGAMYQQIIAFFAVFFIMLTCSAQAALQNTDKTNSQYIVGAKDVLEIIVFGHEDLHKIVSISEDGFISFPLIGKLYVAEREPLQIANDLRLRLEKEYIYNPKVDVIVKEYRSKKITILGEVEQPRIYYLKGDTKILDVLIQLNYNNLEEELFDELIVQRYAKDGTRIKEITIDMHKLFIDREQSLNIPLENNDIIIFKKLGQYTVYGEVKKPGTYILKSNTTILKALAIAGGFTEESNPHKVIILRQENGQSKKINVDVNKITKEMKNTDNILLRPQDYIIIPQRTGGRGFILFNHLRVSPSLEIQEIYYDNIFVRKDDIVSDHVILIRPRVRFDLPYHVHNIKLNYALGIPRFQRNTFLNKLTHSLSTSANLYFSDKASIKFRENFFTSFNRHLAGQASEEIGILESTFIQNRSSMEAQRNFGKRYFIKIAFQDWRLSFKSESIGKNCISKSFSSLLGYKISPKLSFSIQYMIDKNDFDKRYGDIYSLSHNGSLNLNWQKSLKTTLNLKLGYKSHNFVGKIVQLKSPRFEFRLDTILLPFTRVHFQISRNIFQSVYSPNYLFIGTRFGATFSQRFSKKLVCSINATYQQNIFPTKTEIISSNTDKQRHSNFLFFNSKISYDLADRISFILNYNFRRRISNTNYIVNQNIFSGQLLIVM